MITQLISDGCNVPIGEPLRQVAIDSPLEYSEVFDTAAQLIEFPKTNINVVSRDLIPHLTDETVS